MATKDLCFVKYKDEGEGEFISGYFKRPITILLEEKLQQFQLFTI